MSDRELEAVGEVQRRVTRLRLAVMMPSLVLCLVAAFAAGAVWIELGWGGGTRAAADRSLGAIVGLAIAVTLGGGWALYRGLARARAPAWIAELASAHDVPAEELAALARPHLEDHPVRVDGRRWLVAAAIGAGLAGLLVALFAWLAP
ncbi:MAG: hypothetical protein KF729_17920 [Sandaracinaceae bacterium]|nr:hypothetical protein [Sandaracinaceae bacterium]